MGPKNETVICGDAPAKDLSWIDRMYQKLETMCEQVDKNPSLLFQETTKYVESQMNVVGTNVRKLCAELIQDLLPPPALSSEVPVKKPEPAAHCHCDCVASEKSVASEESDQRTANLYWEITGVGNDAASEDALDKGLVTVATEPEGHISRLGEIATQQERTGKEADKVMKRYTENWPSYHDAQQPVEDTEQAAEEERIKEIRSDPKSTYSSIAGNLGAASYHDAQQPVEDTEQAAEDERINDPKSMYSSIAGNLVSCSKERDHPVITGIIVEQAEEEQEQSAQWFVSEDDRRLYRVRNSTSTSSLDFFDGDPQAQGSAEDFDSDWELV